MEYLTAIAGLALPVCAFLAWLALRSAKSEGAAQERADAARDALDEVRKANEALASIDALSADERRKRLQQWSRD
jgi:hypothetical protein